MDVTIRLRVATEEKERWARVATNGNLSKMIRDVVNDHAFRVESARLDPAVEDPVAEQELVRTEKAEKLIHARAAIEAVKAPPLPAPVLKCMRHPGAQQKAGAKRCWCGGPLG